jgi:hypothetical protein
MGENRKLFECLAKGLAVMENGNEEVEGESWGDRHRIVHLDLKDQNGMRNKPLIFLQRELLIWWI